MSTQEYLEENGIRASVHRMAVMDYLINNKNHPTVDIIYNDLHKKVPTLSKTTIYNILKLFVEQGLALNLTIDDKNSRYDGNVSPHAHFRCLSCSCIKDIFPSQLKQLSSAVVDKIENLQITETQIYYLGYCEECQKKNNNN